MDEEDGRGAAAVKPARRGWKTIARRVLVVAALIGLSAVAFVAWTNAAAALAGRGKLHDRAADVPAGGVGLVFGCDDRIPGGENLYFRYRIEAAAELWKTGKLRCLIVSGDNRTKHYNEPQKMRRALVARGVPVNKVICDYAGLRTLDSVVRAKEVFGVEHVVFISQRFQNERAAYLAKAHDLDYSGFNAKDVPGRGGVKTKLREIGARVKMWLDVWMLDTEPRHLGEQEDLPI